MLLLVTLAVLPGAAIALFLYRKDIYDKEPRRQLLKAFLLGSLSVPVAAAIEIGLGRSTVFVEAFLFIALTEELCKFLILMRFFYRRPQFNEPYDGIVYAGFISLGFATLENLFYVLDKGLAVAIVRMFLSVPAHAIFGVVMGYFVGAAKFCGKTRTSLVAWGLATAVFLHGLYDYFLMAGIPILIVFSLALVVVGVVLSLRAIRIRRRQSPFRDQPQQLETGNQKLET